jgi:hypothetical protein
VNSSFVQRTVFLGILALSSVISAHQMAKMKTDSALGEIEKLHQQDVRQPSRQVSADWLLYGATMGF